MDALFRLMLEISLPMGLVIALLLLLRPLLKKHYRARWMYWGWLLVAVRLMIPLNLTLPNAPVHIPQPSLSLFYESPQIATPPASTDVQTPTEAQGSSYQSDNITASVENTHVLPLTVEFVWVAGFCAVLGWELISYARFRRRVKRWRSEEEDGILLARFDALKSELGIKNLTLARCSAISSPMVTGFLRPTLLLPSGDVPEAVLRHELIHAKRHDLWYKLLLVVVRAVHWFNPLVWLMERQAAQDLELSCDEAVVASRDENFRADYGRAILAAVDSGAGKERAPLTSYFNGGKKAMLERLQSILDSKAKRRGAVALALVAVLAISASALCVTNPPMQKVNGGIYTLNVPADIVKIELIEEMPEGFTTSYYRAVFYRDGTLGSARCLFLPGFEDMTTQERTAALEIPSYLEAADYTSPGGLEGLSAKANGAEEYYFSAGGNIVLQLSFYLGPKFDDFFEARFTHAEIEAVLSSLTVGHTLIPAPKGKLALSYSFADEEALWYLWDMGGRSPKLLGTANVPGKYKVLGGLLWSEDGKWAAVPSSDGDLRWNYRIFGVGKEGFEQDFTVALDPTMLSSDYTPIPDTLELRAMEFVNPYADYPALSLSYSLLDTDGNLQSGTLTYTLDITLTGYASLTNVEQSPPHLPTVWQDGSHTLSLSLPSGSTVSAADAQGIRTFTDATGAYLGRISKVAPADAWNQTYQANTQTHFAAWLDETDGRCYQLELTQATLPPFLINRMVESLTMDGNTVEFYYENQIAK